ncbi:hypothetical protein D2E65_01385 [Mycobacteroides abscessus]|uniref:hypothetical protein n=1 Tax=Mycobacteroides abscessus TaxID=36809 RepID=UPI000E68832C|nr:hypothetical protein [Mycobacteroides abscessus]RIR80546.1 hypothetical protein D2E65_01385 [Mycobacteroides abscessus]
MSASLLDPTFLALLKNLDLFIAQEITPGEFETRFMQGNGKLLRQAMDGYKFSYDTYMNLFYAVDDYVEHPDLRTEPEDLGDDDLRQAAVAARAGFNDELAALRLDAYGHPLTDFR